MRRILMAAGVLALAGAAVGIVLPPTGMRCAVGGPHAASAVASTAGSACGPDPGMAGVCKMSCATHAPYDEADVVAQPGAVAGRLTRCPVSGVVFTVRDDATRVTYAGHVWYLCCDGCAKKFRKDPARFTGA